MWRTPDGDRILKGREARLFRELTESIIQEMWDDRDEPAEDKATYINPFGRLSYGQKFVVIHRVVKGLLDPNTPTVEATSYDESCIMSIYKQALGHEHNASLMGLLSKVAGRKLDEDTDTEDIVEDAADTILWDRDYELDATLPDLPPDRAKAVKELARIPEDYCNAVIKEPTAAEDKAMSDEVLALLRPK